MTETRTERLRRFSARAGGFYNLWEDLPRRIREGQVVPIISNAVVNNRIFDIDEQGRIGLGQERDEYDEGHQLAIDDQLAKDWAAFIGYPLVKESPLLLSRVAQYNQIQVGDNEAAKAYYLGFLKLYLLLLAESDQDVADVAKSYLENIEEDTTISEIVNQLGDESFSDLALQLGYPKYEDKQHDPLHLLAQLPLPTYVTTSHHDFLERALVDAGKRPRIQVCSCFGDEGPERPEMEWFGVPPTSGEGVDAEPTAVTPVVYHLYGLEKYPATLVISEDDYMEFLIKVSRDKDIVIHPWLRRALALSSIILLGYRLRSWEFRALFRGIIKTVSPKMQTNNLAIQLNPPTEWKPDSKEMEDYLKEAKGYLQKYFEPNFAVEWDSAVGFAQKLLQKWGESTR